MKVQVLTLAVCAALVGVAGPANAKGCAKGAAVGGVAVTSRAITACWARLRVAPWASIAPRKRKSSSRNDKKRRSKSSNSKRLCSARARNFRSASCR